MFDLPSWLFDISGFVTRDRCGDWSPALMWMHIGGDLFIWLAYLAISLALFYIVRRRELPYSRLFTLSALFILACGFGHLIEAMMFSYPLYRLAGVWKVLTAVISWATVLALMPIIPRVLEVVRAPTHRRGTGDTTLHRLAVMGSLNRFRDYVIAVLVAVLALLTRWAIDPVVTDDHFYVIPLFAVVFVSWWCGFGPGILSLLLSMLAMVYVFLPPRGSFVVNGISNQLATAAFFFCGACCALLGEAQRLARKRTKIALEIALERKAELEAEVAHRREIELALRQSEATLRAFYESAPLPMGIVEPLVDDVVHVYDNVASSRFFGVEPGGTKSRRATALGTPPEVLKLWLNKYRESSKRGEPVRFEYQYDATDGKRWLSSTVTSIGTDPRGRQLFCYVSEDTTEQKRAEAVIRRNERNLTDFFENANVGMHWVGPDGIIIRANRAELEMLGYTSEEYVGRPIADFHDDPVAICDILDRLTRGERLDNYPARLLCKDGTTRDVLISSNVLWEDGKFVHTRCFTRDVTDLLRAENALAERARIAMLRADVATALSREEGTRTALNECAERLVEHLGAAFARVWTMDDAGQWLELQASAGMYVHLDGPHGRIRLGEFKIGRIAATGRPHITNDVAHDPNVSDLEWAEREKIVSFAGYPLVVEKRVLGVMALFARHPLPSSILTDLGLVAESIAQYLERRRAEEAMRSSEEKFRTLADNISQFAWMTDETGWIHWYNRRWFDYTGTTHEEMQGWGWKAVHHPDHVERVVEKFARSIQKGEKWEDTFPLRGRDGTYRWFLSRANPIRDATGRIVHWFGTNTDITDQRTLEEALRHAAERYQTLTEAIPQIVWNTDADGEATYFNRRWLEYTGVPVEEARGPGWEKAIHADDRDRVFAAWRATVECNKASDRGDQFTQELRLKKKGAADSYRWFLSRAVPLRRADGTVDQWIGLMADIHDQKTAAESLEKTVRDRTSDLLDEIEERRRAEQQVRVVAAELARSNGELEQFAYIASHDLQEPLRKIQAFGDRLRTRYRDALPDTGKEYIDLMQTSAGRMRRLIDDLLNFSRVTTTARPFRRVNLTKLIHEVVGDLEVLIEQAGATVEVGEIPEISADPSQMRQLFQNLIANALKFRRPGMASLVRVSGEIGTEILPNHGAPSDICRIFVQDSGIGFDEKYLGRIFQVFQRLHGRNEYEGTGVGLAICRKIAERHGGTITAHSRSGEGATFVVTLPLRHSHEETNPDVQLDEVPGDNSRS